MNRRPLATNQERGQSRLLEYLWFGRVRNQVKSGRYMDFSAAVQDAAWNFFAGPCNPFAEYGVTPEELERIAQRDLAAIHKDRKDGKLTAWKPGE